MNTRSRSDKSQKINTTTYDFLVLRSYSDLGASPAIDKESDEPISPSVYKELELSPIIPPLW